MTANNYAVKILLEPERLLYSTIEIEASAYDICNGYVNFYYSEGELIASYRVDLVDFVRLQDREDSCDEIPNKQLYKITLLVDGEVAYTLNDVDTDEPLGRQTLRYITTDPTGDLYSTFKDVYCAPHGMSCGKKSKVELLTEVMP